MRTYPSEDGNAAFVSLSPGEDLVEGLYAAVDELRIEAATIQVIGGLTEAVVGYLDPASGEYVPQRTGHVELAAGLGNVSLRNGKPFIHLHVTVSGPDGTIGGHAMEGCRAYVVEAYFRKLGGAPPVRQDVEGVALKAWPGA